MSASFFFYDLETSGISPFNSRVMQFAGRRTDMQLKPIGEPINVMVSLSPDIVPDPEAVLITGITPQAVNADGYTEAEFLRIFTDEIALPGTVFVGFNTVRFDDEFIRALHYRNFYDPYEWQWQDGRSKWDMLDVVRMTRALRPEGINWPFDIKGNPTNRLELLTGLNGLDHAHAHDALSDVDATIAVARLIRNKQTKLFDYLFTLRDKRAIASLVEGGQPFVYTSGKYPGEFEKTTLVHTLCPHPTKQGSAFVYDLRHDPTEYKDMTPQQLAERWQWKKDAEEPRLPVKVLQYNRCPAIAPAGVLDDASRERLKIDMAIIQKNLAVLKKMPDLEDRLCQASEIIDAAQQARFKKDTKDVDAQMYDSFFNKQDVPGMRVVRAARPEELGDLGISFKDARLTELLPLYKARNYPKLLTSEERAAWEKFCAQKLMDGGQHSKLARYFTTLHEIAARGNLTEHQTYLLEELRLYGESIMPEASDE